MPGPLLALAAPIIAQGVGALVGRLVGGKRKIPDLITPAVNVAQQTISDQESANARQAALLETRLARAGSVGFAGGAARENLQRAIAQGNAAVRAGIGDTLSRARQQDELIRTEAKNAERQALIEGITGGFGAAGQGLGSLLSPGVAPPTGALAFAGQAASLGDITPPSILSSAPPSDLTQPLPIGLNAPGVAVGSTPTLDNFSIPFFPVVGQGGTFANNLFSSQQ